MCIISCSEGLAILLKMYFGCHLDAVRMSCNICALVFFCSLRINIITSCRFKCCINTVKSLMYDAPNPKIWMSLVSVSSCSCLWPIHWSQLFCREWKCSWSGAWRCSNCTWLVKNIIAYQSAFVLQVWRKSWKIWVKQIGAKPHQSTTKYEPFAYSVLCTVPPYVNTPIYMQTSSQTSIRFVSSVQTASRHAGHVSCIDFQIFAPEESSDSSAHYMLQTCTCMAVCTEVSITTHNICVGFGFALFCIGVGLL